ncbi:MAG TPA: hypothetical protein VEQ40_00500 [Pyrinomonadaceae bacterium]|nr:hypothetical protein [Pyrinomonadaceae bacterium]
MAANEYHFISEWRVEGTVEEVSTILEDAIALPRWWPSVYLSVEELEPKRAARPDLSAQPLQKRTSARCPRLKLCERRVSFYARASLLQAL